LLADPRHRKRTAAAHTLAAADTRAAVTIARYRTLLSCCEAGYHRIQNTVEHGAFSAYDGRHLHDARG
jgi:hypothetical protein